MSRIMHVSNYNDQNKYKCLKKGNYWN